MAMDLLALLEILAIFALGAGVTRFILKRKYERMLGFHKNISFKRLIANKKRNGNINLLFNNGPCVIVSAPRDTGNSAQMYLTHCYDNDPIYSYHVMSTPVIWGDQWTFQYASGIKSIHWQFQMANQTAIAANSLIPSHAVLVNIITPPKTAEYQGILTYNTEGKGQLGIAHYSGGMTMGLPWAMSFVERGKEWDCYIQDVQSGLYLGMQDSDQNPRWVMSTEKQVCICVPLSVLTTA